MLRLCRVSLAGMPIRVGVREASNMPLISRVKRATYVRHYPTVLVQPDGSTITARYHEPRSLIRLPLKFEELTPEEQQLVLAKRKPPEVVVIQEELEDNFDSQRYLKFIKKKNLCRVSLAGMPIRVGVREASNMPLISRVKRATYVRHYPTVLVQPDGSTITARYHEPRSLIRLPLKFEELTPEEQQLVLAKRKPPEVVVIQEELEDNFDSQRYLKFIKKKK